MCEFSPSLNYSIFLPTSESKLKKYFLHFWLRRVEKGSVKPFSHRLLAENLVHTRKNYMLLNLTSSVPCHLYLDCSNLCPKTWIPFLPGKMISFFFLVRPKHNHHDNSCILPSKKMRNEMYEKFSCFVEDYAKKIFNSKNIFRDERFTDFLPIWEMRSQINHILDKNIQPFWGQRHTWTQNSTWYRVYLS